VHTWLTAPLQQPVLQKSEDIPMFNAKSKKYSEKNLTRMPFISWTERMSVDVKLLDNDNKKLAILLTDLHGGIVAGRNKQALENAFEGVLRQVRIHFSHEEQLFAETGYPDATIHEQEHFTLMERVKDLHARFKRENEFASRMEVVNLLKGWLFGHIQSSDQEYVPHFKAKNIESIQAAWERPLMVLRQKSAARRPRVVTEAWPA
jgi:hemerythrin-like metal-binding protein